MKKFSAHSTEQLLPHIRPSTKNRMRKYLYICMVLIGIFLLYRSLNKDSSSSPIVMGRNGDMTVSAEYEEKKVAQLNTVKVDIYMESQCPDTSRFFRQQLKTMWELLGESQRVELTVVPFGKARCLEKGDDFGCECQHGEAECEINQLMNCVIDRIGFPHKYVGGLLCMQGQHSLESAMQCVSGILPGEEKRIRECASGPRGRRLLALSGQRTAALVPPLDFIPWIVIDGVQNTDALYDLSQNVCEAMKPMSEKCVEYLKSDQR